MTLKKEMTRVLNAHSGNKRVPVFTLKTTDAVTEKLSTMKITSHTAQKIKNAIVNIQTTPIDVLIRQSNVRTVRGTDMMLYRVDSNAYLVLSVETAHKDIVLCDIIVRNHL